MRACLAILAILLLISPLLIAQEEEQVPAEPEVTKFYFGQNLEGDMLMVQGMVRFDTRAPMGMLGGFISGVTGEVEVWLDSIMLVEQVEEEEPEPVETESEQVEEEPQETPVDSILDETQEETLAETLPGAEDEVEEPEAVDTTPVIEPPTGYQMPSMNLEIPLSTLYTGNAQRDSILMSESYLDIANYPTATFKLTRIESPSSYQLEDNTEISLVGSGQLTLHGQTVAVGNIRIFMTYIAAKPLTEKNLELTGDVLHINAELNIKLSAFGIVIPTEDLLTLDDEVLLIFDAYATTEQVSM